MQPGKARKEEEDVASAVLAVPVTAVPLLYPGTTHLHGAYTLGGLDDGHSDRLSIRITNDDHDPAKPKKSVRGANECLAYCIKHMPWVSGCYEHVEIESTCSSAGTAAH